MYIVLSEGRFKLVLLNNYIGNTERHADKAGS